MDFKNTPAKFGVVSKTFHWLIFVMITAQLYFIWMFETLSKDDPGRGNFMFLHKSMGATILVIAILWIIWRLFNVLPTPRPHARSWQHYLAKTVHTLLLIGIVVLPITGILMGMASGRSLDWFGVFTLNPASFIPQNDTLAGLLRDAHIVIAFSIIGLVGMHIVGALVHHFAYKDDVLKRMLP